MRATCKLGVTLVICLTAVATVQAQYYYEFDQKVPLQVDYSMFRVKFEDGFDLDSRNAIYANLPEVKAELEADPNIDGFVTVALDELADYAVAGSKLGLTAGVEQIEPYYRSPTGEPLVMGARFCVGFNSDLSREAIDDINTEYKVEFDRELYGMPNVVVLRNTREAELGLLDLANAYHELDETYFSQPSVSGAFKKASYELEDQYHEYCTHVKEVIGEFNVRTVWDFAGLTDSLAVAVIDDGVTSHPDLPAARILPGYWVYDGNSNATPGPQRGHGMACAGLIAAEHSVVGGEKNSPLDDAIISINPHALIMPIRIMQKYGDPWTGITWAWRNGATILSNSWMASGFIMPIYYATQNAVDSGRGGLGCPVIFAAGNDALEYLPSTAGWSHTFAGCGTVCLQ